MQLLSVNLDQIPFGLAAVAGMALAKMSSLYYLNKYGADTWVWTSRVSRLFIYPLKSVRGIEVESMTVTRDGAQSGPVKDRSWMIISADGNLVTQRNMERIALMRQSIEDEKLVVTAPGMERLVLDPKQKVENGKIRNASLFGHQVAVLDTGEESHRWICQFLDRDNLHIVYLSPELENIDLTQFNQVDNHYARDGDKKALHDDGPFMLLTQPSIDDVDSRIPTDKIDVFRFRPNIVVDGCSAYDEDEWQMVQIGEANFFTRVSMCSRCIFTTVNPNEPNKAKESLEPLKTLRTYRLAPDHNGYGRSPIMGVYFCPDTIGGAVNVGDDVFAVKQHY